MTEQIANRQGVTTDLIDISQMPLPVDDAGNFGNVANVFDESGKLLDQAFIKRADTDGPTDGCRFSATKPARLRGKPAAPPGNLRLE